MVVDTEKVLAGSGWTRVNARGDRLNSAHGSKGGRLWERSACPTESPKTISDSPEFYGWTAKTANIGAAIRQIPNTFLIPMLEDKIQKSSEYLF